VLITILRRKNAWKTYVCPVRPDHFFEVERHLFKIIGILLLKTLSEFCILAIFKSFIVFELKNEICISKNGVFPLGHASFPSQQML